MAVDRRLLYLAAMPPTSSTISIWCPFCRIPSAALAAMVAERCLFSLDTLEFACFPEAANFALSEHQHAETWRWATVNSRGEILEEGREPTEQRAQYAAEAALRLSSA